MAGYFAVLAGLGGHAGWERLGVPPISPVFADLRSVTSAWECTREGVPVLPQNPCDPFDQRPANYPRVWLWPSFLGLGQESTFAFGIVVALLFFAAALVVLPRDASTVDAAIFGLAVCSPAVMLGIERGNVDLALFALVAAGVLLLQRGTAGRLAGHALVLLAAILKLFPIFAAVVLVRRTSRRALLLASAVIGLFALYVLATLENVRVTARVVPQTDHLSYGIRRFTGWLSGFLHEHVGPLSLDLAVAGIVVAAIVLLRVTVPRLLPGARPGAETERDLDLFYAGAGVYVASYALFRSWDYRLVFVLLTIPQLLRWVRHRDPVAMLGLVSLFGVLWLDAEPFSLGDGLTAAVAAQLLLFACLTAGLIGTLDRPLRRHRSVP